MRAHQRRDRAGVTRLPGGMGRKDGQPAGGGLELRSKEHADVEGTPAGRQLASLPVPDRDPAEERRAFGEAQHRPDSAMHVLALEWPVRGGRADVMVAQRGSETGRHVTSAASGRRLLKPDDVGVERPESFDRHAKPRVKGLGVAAQLREDAPVEQVEGDEAQREGPGRRRIRRDRAGGRPEDAQRRAGGDQRAAEPRHGLGPAAGLPEVGPGHVTVRPTAGPPGFSR
jgi:hypothetical protein